MTSKSSSSSMTGFCLISFNHICMLPSVSSLDGCQEPDEVDDIGDTLEIALSQHWLEELVAGKESLGWTLVLDVVVVEVEDANQSLEEEDSFGKVKVT